MWCQVCLDSLAVDKQVLLSWTGSSRSGQVSAVSPDKTDFRRTRCPDKTGCRRTEELLAWEENVAAAAAVADFPSKLVLLEHRPAGQATAVT